MMHFIAQEHCHVWATNAFQGDTNLVMP